VPHLNGAPVNGHSNGRAGAAHDPFWLGRRLVELKRITPEQLQSAVEDFRRRPSEPFPRALERLSLVSQKVIAQLTAEHHGLEMTEISPTGIPLDLVKRLSLLRARNHGAVPCRDDGSALVIAV